ncbi:MAG TPA: ferritin-like domain-containing protein [Acidimicrobiales bacterium]|nr:ferritin-like domain-containing protein [Acidimicrobiales bacterium]
MQPHDIDAPAGRRQFLKLGGGAVLGAAVLAACGSDEESLPAETGTTVPTTATTLAPPQGTTPEEGAANDAVVTRTLRSFELAAVEVYGVLLSDEPASTDPDVTALPAAITYAEDVDEVLTLLGERHTAHAAALVSVVSAAGGEPVSEPNQGVLDVLLMAQLPDLTTQEAVLRLARSVEEIGAATHAWAAGVVTTAELRQDLMAIGAVAARQTASVDLLLDPTGQSAALQPMLDTSGPARLPEALLVQEGQDGGDVSADPEAAAAEGEGTGDGAESEGDGGGGAVGESDGGG